MKKFLATLMTLVCAIGCMFALASCGNEEAESVTLSKTELTLEVGAEETLTATVSPETATDKTVTWESSAPDIASVDGGKVTAKAAGTATITAKTKNDKSATCTVTVKLTLTEQTDFASLKSDKVTETEWKAAFSDNTLVNFTAKAVNGDATFLLQRQTEGTDKLVRMSMEEDDFSAVIYATVEGGKQYVYTNESGSFVRVEYSGSTGEDIMKLYMSPTSLLPDLSKEYSKFAYDEQKSAYTYGGEGIDCGVPFGDGTFTYTDITLKIVDGKLAYISCYRVGDDENGHHSDGEYVFTAYNYGKTTVTLPTDFTEAE